jgi:hypothetical protein
VNAAGMVTATLPYAGGTIDGQSNTIGGVSAGYLAELHPGYFIVGYGIPNDTRILC